MTLDVRGSLKKAKLNNNVYTFSDELFSNAIDSFLIRKNIQKDVTDLKIKFTAEFSDLNLEGTLHDLTIRCSDNGIGLGAEQTKAFVTKDTSYKDDLKIQGIGECKGSGRIQYFLYFSDVSIESVYKADGQFVSKSLMFSDKKDKEIDESTFKEQPSTSRDVGFEISLKSLKEEAFQNIQKYGGVKSLFSAERLKNHVIVFFLQRLVTLKDQLGSFEISFESIYKEEVSTSFIRISDLPKVSSVQDVKSIIPDSRKEVSFTVSHYKLDKKKFDLTKNTVAMCAKSTIVADITNKFLKNKTLENNDLNGFYHIVLIESEYLNYFVNEQRDGFDLPKTPSEKEQISFLEPVLSLDEVYSIIDETVMKMLSPPGWNKEIILQNVSKKYGISGSMIQEADVRVRFGDTEESIVKRVLASYNEKIIKDTSEIFDIKDEILNLNPGSDNFRNKINEIAWKHTSSLKRVDMANLSQVVVRRSAIISVLRLAVQEELKIQKENSLRKNNESIIHNIFFPMRKDSTEVSEHDVWLLNEEYHYFDYIASDVALSNMKLDGVTLFESDIDMKLDEIMSKNTIENERKRPDIAIFGKDGAAIIIEFKSPGVSLDEHTGDLMEYSQLLAAKSKGKLKRFYGYLIGTDINNNRVRGYKRFANGKGWFGTEEIVEHSTGARLGELYSEILNYNDVIDKASTKLEVYKRKLGLE